ncbi:MAG: MerR family transcriptional regulator [Pseudomonadota bacterium]|nr:MerR family transcriptional regulator [Pseudomonadota bacterium]MEC8102753.1 MerR family transcriptional regulator [Pseudomonadota bacterium]
MNIAETTGYPIREFARLTGVNPVTLRAWERRYGIIQPLRTPKGHRYYTDDHVDQVKSILYWLDQGYPIRQVKLLLNEPPADPARASDDWEQLQNRQLSAARDLNSRALDDEWSNGLASYPMGVYYERCLLPVLDTLRQSPDEALILHAYSHLLQRKLTQLVQLQQKHAEGPGLLMCTNDHQAELHILAASYALGAAGFRLEYFGVNLNPDDVRIVSDRLDFSWVWAHIHPSNSDEQQQWQALSDKCRIPVYFSGAIPKTTAEDYALKPPMNKQIQTFITHAGGFA